MVQGDGRQTPHTILPVTKHRHGESVLVAGAEVCVAAVLRVAQVGQGQGENLLHLSGVGFEGQLLYGAEVSEDRSDHHPRLMRQKTQAA